MTEPQDSGSRWRQRFKWAVYALLFANFLTYLWQDIESAPYTLHEGSSILDVLAAYVTSIDLVAWFTLILLFELETYVLVDRDWTGATKRVVQGVRLACYVAILHTSFSYDFTLREYYQAKPLPAADDVCAYSGNWTFLRNRDYLAIDASNCRAIGRGPAFFALGDDAILTDAAGLREATILAWTDLAESVTWLLVMFLTETAVRLAERTGYEALVLNLERAKILLYSVILAIAAYWGSKGQLLYLWDELLWVLGFLVIDWNIRDWQTFKRAISVSRSPA